MLRRAAILAVTTVLVACGGASNESAFDEPAPDTGTTSTDDSAVVTDSTAIDEDATITDTDIPPDEDGGVIDDTSTSPTDTAVPSEDTGTPVVDTGVPTEDSGVVRCTETGGKVYMGHCYFPIGNRSFTSARDACAAAGAHLATITSAGEQAHVNTVGMGDRWIGLAIFTGSTSFRWITGEAMSYMNWATGEPNRSGYCARLRGVGGWGDLSCNTLLPAVCERDK